MPPFNRYSVQAQYDRLAEADEDGEMTEEELRAAAQDAVDDVVDWAVFEAESREHYA